MPETKRTKKPKLTYPKLTAPELTPPKSTASKSTSPKSSPPKSPAAISAKNLSGLALNPRKHPRFANFVAATSNVCTALHACLQQLQVNQKFAVMNESTPIQIRLPQPHNTDALLSLALSSTWLLGEYAHQQFAPYNTTDPDMQNAIKIMHEAFDMLAQQTDKPKIH